MGRKSIPKSQKKARRKAYNEVFYRENRDELLRKRRERYAANREQEKAKAKERRAKLKAKKVKAKKPKA